MPEHSEWMEGVRRPLANGKESGAKIRVEKTKAIINFGIMIGPVALNMVSMAIAAQKAVKTGEK